MKAAKKASKSLPVSRILLVFLAFLASLSPTRPAWGETPDAPALAALKNGLRIAVQTRRVSPLVAIDVWVQAGAREERAGEAGCAHFLEHTLFKGTETRQAGDADIAIENLGATLNAATGPDYAHFYTTVASAHLAPALDVIADVIAHATLPPDEIERERGVIVDELVQHNADPTAHLIDLLYARAFPDQPYAHTPGGTLTDIRARTRSELLTFYRRCYQPSRCLVVLTGDLDAETVRREVERTFGEWRITVNHAMPAISSASSPVTTQAQHTGEAEAVQKVETVQPPAFALAFPMPAARETDASAAQVVTALLGDAKQRGRLGSSPALDGWDIAARWTPRQDAALLTLTALPADSRPASTQESAAAEAAIRRVVQSLWQTPPGRHEIANAQGRILGSLAWEGETNGGLARLIGYALTVGGDRPDTLPARLNAVTARDVAAFAQHYLTDAKTIVVRLNLQGNSFDAPH